MGVVTEVRPWEVGRQARSVPPASPGRTEQSRRPMQPTRSAQRARPVQPVRSAWSARPVRSVRPARAGWPVARARGVAAPGGVLRRAVQGLGIGLASAATVIGLGLLAEVSAAVVAPVSTPPSVVVQSVLPAGH